MSIRVSICVGLALIVNCALINVGKGVELIDNEHYTFSKVNFP